VRLALSSLLLLVSCTDPTPLILPTPPGSVAPPVSRAIQGGNLAMARDGRTAIVTDADTAQIFLVDTISGLVRAQVRLPGDAVPFRAVADHTRAYISLRGVGQIAVVDIATGALEATWNTCREPRGLALHDGMLRVACSTGTLLGLETVLGLERERLWIGKDLRDIVSTADGLWVSRWRTADVFRVVDGAVVQHDTSPDITQDLRGRGALPYVASVGWRLFPTDDGVGLIHQRTLAIPLDTLNPDPTSQAYYTDPPPPPGYEAPTDDCSAVTVSAVTFFAADAPPDPSGVLNAPLPVDALVTPTGLRVAAAARIPDQYANGVREFDWAQLSEACATDRVPYTFRERVTGLAVNIAGVDIRVTHTPLRLYIGTDPVDLDPGIPDPSLDLFHDASNTAGLSCASCHPEGNDDGVVWQFSTGPLRTQNVAVGLTDTEPFHWAADMWTFDDLMERVYVERMGGSPDVFTEETSAAMLAWMDLQRPDRVDPSGDRWQVAEGALLFDAAGCAGCHRGTRYTDGDSYDVGTGRTLQTPSLVGVGGRGPYLHNGCAPELADRFGPCGGGDLHGQTSELTPDEVDSLVAFLETL
jgi:mono/diheme cytochrome c family protein